MSNLIVFQDKKVRRIWNEANSRWYFSITDVVEILTGTDRPRKYWNDLKSKLNHEGSELSEKIGQLKMQSADGKFYDTDVADTEQLFRLIQSIPSPKAEPFKRWLAKVGYERLEEIENPEIATKRMREIYKQKGYSDEWIEKRMRGIAVRDELTEEWKKRGVKEHLEYAILTSEISKATFGMTPTEYKNFKSLSNPKENLRDHMTDLEIIFTMLGEASTTQIAKNKNAQGLPENKKAAIEGGTVAGNARLELEEKSGIKVSTETNYKEIPEAKIRTKKISSNEESSNTKER
ncbi:MAG: Bro-N domain-containing protein [Candidatus Micrarchaeota archaeon]